MPGWGVRVTDRPRGAALQGSPCPPPPPASTTCCSWGCAPGGHATSPPAALPSMPSASSSASTLLPTSCASMPIKHPSCRGSSRPPPSGHGEWCRRCPPPRVPPTTAPHVPRDGLQPARLLLGSHPAHSPALWGWRHCWFQGVNAIHVPLPLLAGCLASRTSSYTATAPDPTPSSSTPTTPGPSTPTLASCCCSTTPWPRC